MNEKEGVLRMQCGLTLVDFRELVEGWSSAG